LKPGTRSFGCAALAAVLAVLFAAFGVAVPALAGEAGLETRYARIVFDDEADLYEFGRSLGGPGSMASRENPNLRLHVRESVDRIVFRVKALLDMHPGQLSFIVLIHPTDRALREAYRGLGAVGEPPVAFYSHRSKTVHVGLRGAAPGVFAHEVAHAVINSYFSVPPPAQMQEILAQYVDRHLFEE